MSAHSLNYTIQQKNLNMTQLWDKLWLNLTMCLVSSSISQGVPDKFESVLIDPSVH